MGRAVAQPFGGVLTLKAYSVSRVVILEYISESFGQKNIYVAVWYASVYSVVISTSMTSS
jgi:hypothetical protein